MKPLDDNDQHRNGTLPDDPFADAEPFEPPSPPESAPQPRAEKSEPGRPTAANENDGQQGVGVRGPNNSSFLRGDHVELGQRLIDRLAPPNELVFDELHMWRYDHDRGLWIHLERAEESRTAQAFAGARKSGGIVKLKASDVNGAIALARDQAARPGFFADAERGIAFANGFLRISADGAVLLDHGPEHRVRVAYPFAYSPSKPPQRFLKFLDDLFRDDDDRADKVRFIQEFFGACMLGLAPTYQRCVVGIGDGSNGKSRLAEIMAACMPAGTTTAIAPQDWGHEYKRAMFVGKLCNIVMELPEADIIASEAFKAIVTGDLIVGRVIREKPAMFRPAAGHFFAANRLPGTADQTEGFWRRIVVVTFNRSFENDPTRDPAIAETIVREELAEIVSWLVDGAVRLMHEGEYTIPPSHTEAVAQWRRDSNQVALFRADELGDVVPNAPIGEWARASDIYTAYKRWTESNGHRPMASNTFGKRLKGLGIKSDHTRDGNRYAVFIKRDKDSLW